MQVGDVIETKKIRAIIQEGDGYFEFGAPKGQAFVFLLLGVQDIKGGEKIDVNKTLNNLGWEFEG